MTSVFGDLGRAEPHAPVAMTPAVAAEGGPDAPGRGAGLDLSVFVSLGASIGTLADELRAERDARAHQAPPGNEQLFQVGVAPASGIVTLDLGAVPLGRVWQVRRLIVGGVDVSTVAAGKAYAFAQGAPPADLNLTNCVGIYATLPAIEKFGTHQLFLPGNEHLWVVFTGATEGQQYAASARVEDWDDGAFASAFAE